MADTNTAQRQDIVKAETSVQPFSFFNPEQFATLQRVCTMFASSELVPEIYRISEKNPKDKAIANCMIAIETANRIGASPLMVMQNMYIVYGQPAWSAKFLTATVNGCGRFHSIKYKLRSLGSLKGMEYTEYEWKNENGKNRKVPVKKRFEEDIEDFECIAYTSEKGSDEILESIPVTIKMAVLEGWYTKDGSKWKTMPKLMLQYRAVTFWTRAYAPELSMGIKTEDEVQDVYIPYEDVSTKVGREIDQKANRSPLRMDDPPTNGHAAASHQSEPVVEPDPNKDQAPEVVVEKTNDNPGATLNGAPQTLGPGF
jgi:hypothetical protein